MAKVHFDFDTDIRPVSDFRANTSATLDHVRDTGRPLVLTQHGRSAAILLDVGAFQSLLDELEELRDVAAALADEREGRLTDHDEARARLLENHGR